MYNSQYIQDDHVALNKESSLDSQKGFTALELIIVLIVGFSIIALSASKMGELFSNSASTEAVSSILGVYSSARALKGPHGYGSEDVMPLMIDTKTVPKNLGIKSDSTFNEWGGKVTVPTINEGHGFSINYPKVPTESCTKIAQQMVRSGNFSNIKIGETKLTSESTISDIVKGCKSSNDSTEMVFNVNSDDS